MIMVIRHFIGQDRDTGPFINYLSETHRLYSRLFVYLYQGLFVYDKKEITWDNYIHAEAINYLQEKPL
jgi:hypothetical protein